MVLTWRPPPVTSGEVYALSILCSLDLYLQWYVASDHGKTAASILIMHAGSMYMMVRLVLVCGRDERVDCL